MEGHPFFNWLYGLGYLSSMHVDPVTTVFLSSIYTNKITPRQPLPQWDSHAVHIRHLFDVCHNYKHPYFEVSTYDSNIFRQIK